MLKDVTQKGMAAVTGAVAQILVQENAAAEKLSHLT
jgi:hypothetical protein